MNDYTTFTDDELFGEAADEVKSDVDDCLARAIDEIPAEEAVRAVDDTCFVDLDSLITTLNIDAVGTAIRDARKWFTIGKRAGTFNDDYITKTEAAIATFEETVDVLREIETVNKLVEEGEITKAREKLATLESRLITVQEKAIEYDLNDLHERITALKQLFDELQGNSTSLESERDPHFSKERILNRLQGMNEYDFEELVAKVWEKRGWDTTVTQGSNDRGIDVIAKKDSPFSQKHLIQAKKYASGNKVGAPEIQQYSSLRHQEADVDAIIVVTTSSFSRQAEQAAKDLNVKLIDGSTLRDIIAEAEAEGLLIK